MQTMSWIISRLGSRFSLLFEPHHRRVMHSGLGRFVDEPVDLMVGLEEPDGAPRVLPLSQRGEPLYNPEQFERANSLTFRGYSERWRLRFEFNIHSVFYPREERMCVMPAFYLEMRVNPVDRVGRFDPAGPCPEEVTLFLNLQRPNTDITVKSGECNQLDLSYEAALKPVTPVVEEKRGAERSPAGEPRTVTVTDRIISLNPDCEVDADGHGLRLKIPVTREGSGTKWRLVWGSYCGDPVLHHQDGDDVKPLRFRYAHHWANIDEVMDAAIDQRDKYLAHSRRFEKILDSSSMDTVHGHLLNFGVQHFLANTFWCGEPESDDDWFSVMEGSSLYHSTLDVEYSASPWYLSVWPDLLRKQLRQWAKLAKTHEPSGGAIMPHDLGRSFDVGRVRYPHQMPVEENSNFLLMLESYASWTGDLTTVKHFADLVHRLGNYLLATDTDESGFPSDGTNNSLNSSDPMLRFARKQTPMAVKRVMALRSVSSLLERLGHGEKAGLFEQVYQEDVTRIEQQAWLGDHYALCIDPSLADTSEQTNGQPVPAEKLMGWDSYSIHCTSAMLLPLMIGRTPLLDEKRLHGDLIATSRETLDRYGCGHSSHQRDHVSVSQNMWREHLSRYLDQSLPSVAQRAWDLQVMSNTGEQSLGFTDCYVHNMLCFYPRGVVAFGFLLAAPRLKIDRLAPGGARLIVDPDRHHPQRWPLLPLADWKAGKIPICVVTPSGRVYIENEADPIVIRGGDESLSKGMIG